MSNTSNPNMSKKICIYHANCADGFGAAWVVRHAHNPDTVEFFPGIYNQPPPDVEDKTVYIVDFSYPKEVILEMAESAHNIVIIDHHKTAIEALVDLPYNVELFCDINHSGAMLTWKYLFCEKEPPELLRHIEDRDLWKFALEGTREIQANIFSYPYDFEVWDNLMESNVKNLFFDGLAIERKHFKDINELLLKTTRRINIYGFKVKTANLPYTYGSDAAMMLAEGEPFACTYYDLADRTRYYSLRSTADGIDVSEIAKVFGGGGHKHAAAFTISIREAEEFELS